MLHALDATSTGTGTGDLVHVAAAAIGAASHGLILLGVLFTIGQLVYMAISAGDGRSRARDRVPGLSGSVGAVVIGFAARLFADTVRADSRAAAPGSTDTPDPLPMPEAATDPGDGFDPLMLLVVLGALGALCLAVLTGFSIRRRILDRREERQCHERDWAAARAAYTEVLDDYATYLTDPYAWLDRPILEDVDEPSTAGFFDALAAAQSLDLDVVPTDPQRIERFRVAATDLRTAWDKADRNARAIGTTIYEPRSRGKLRQAASALRTALDESATTDERAAAVDAVNRLTDGLVKAPERVLGTVTTAIATSRRKELPVGRTPYPGPLTSN